MTEEQIERMVARMVDHLDRLYMAGEVTEASYKKAIEEVDEWAKARSGDAR